MNTELAEQIVGALASNPQTARDLVRIFKGSNKTAINSVLYALQKDGVVEKDDSTAPVWSVAEVTIAPKKKSPPSDERKKVVSKSSSSDEEERQPTERKKFVLPSQIVVFASGGDGEDDFKQHCRSFRKIGVKITVFSRDNDTEETIIDMTETLIMSPQVKIILAFGSYNEDKPYSIIKATKLFRTKYGVEIQIVKNGWEELKPLLE
uniref:Z-binding domain-containing protein n=1 Tax=viral metagenome TaxID=1070528 RepID=A0A6C0CFF9_9ZZZZ